MERKSESTDDMVDITPDSAPTIARAWLADNRNTRTARTYQTYSGQFRDFCAQNGLAREQPESVVLFMKELVERGLAINTINKVAIAAIADEYRLDDDAKNPVASRMVKAAKQVVRRLAKPEQQKLPLTPEMVRRICELGVDSTDRTRVRDIAMVVLQMAGFVRESEIAGLGAEDVWIDEVVENSASGSTRAQAVFLFIEKSKTDVERRGHTVVVGCNCEPGRPAPVCPLHWVERWNKLRDQKSGHYFHQKNGRKLAEQTPNAILKRLLRAIGVDPKRYGSHSGRSGGTSAAAEQGIAVALLKRHGNWKSDCVFRYIRPSSAELLAVSRAVFASLSQTVSAGLLSLSSS
jgi:integrase